VKYAVLRFWLTRWERTISKSRWNPIWKTSHSCR
jgi:hypothetical protein